MAGAQCNPCPSWQPRSINRANVDSLSTPSAIVTSPRLEVIWTIARTMASSCLSSVSLRMND